MKINIGAGIQFRSGLARDVYAAGGVRPKFVAAFSDGVYRVDSAASTFADAFTLARTGTATFVDADGILQTAATGVARTGHHIWNGSEWAGPFLRLESEARTNLVTYSEDFTDASWSKTNSGVALAPIVTANSAISPDGTLNADLVAFNLNGGSTTADRSEIRTSLTISNATAYSSSMYVKAASVSDVGKTIRISIDGITNAVNIVLTEEYQRIGQTGTSGATSANYRIEVRGTFNDDQVSVNLWGAQLEAGSTPSSYIPTTGTTATRNAETLTIAAADAPWPEPVVIGPELVTNGTFDTDTSGWTSTRSATLTFSSGTMRVAANGTAFGAAARQVISTVAGKVYKANFQITDSLTNGRVAVSDGIADLAVAPSILDRQNLVDGSYTIFFVAQSAQTSLLLGTMTNSATDYVEYDNVSVQEINPLSVSIQMEGTVTYADNNDATEALFYDWALDNNNRIFASLRTNVGTGQQFFRQTAAGTADFVSTSGDYYTPGVNVPFNFASRHGTTFINGAVDGTALTADTTPTALPDLSATGVQIGPDFMGTIKLFRIWAEDIGDAGIAAASA